MPTIKTRIQLIRGLQALVAESHGASPLFERGTGKPSIILASEAQPAPSGRKEAA
jgi:hypothetical protein